MKVKEFIDSIDKSGYNGSCRKRKPMIRMTSFFLWQIFQPSLYKTEWSALPCWIMLLMLIQLYFNWDGLWVLPVFTLPHSLILYDTNCIMVKGALFLLHCTSSFPPQVLKTSANILKKVDSYFNGKLLILLLLFVSYRHSKSLLWRQTFLLLKQQSFLLTSNHVQTSLCFVMHMAMHMHRSKRSQKNSKKNENWPVCFFKTRIAQLLLSCFLYTATVGLVLLEKICWRIFWTPPEPSP